MDIVRAEELTKVRREKSRRAVSLALEGRWQDAYDANLDILQGCPDDVEALNRLGKALLELGRYSEARQAFERAMVYSPYNTIAKKNLKRLSHFDHDAPFLQPSTKSVALHPFIEDGGRSRIMMLEQLSPYRVFARMAAGDEVTLINDPKGLVVKNWDGEYLGLVEAKPRMRLSRLIEGGNRYGAAITKINYPEVSIIIWESYRHPDLTSVSSFPTKGRGDYTLSLRDPLLRYQVEKELEEDEEFSPEWQEGETPLSDNWSISSMGKFRGEEDTEEEE